MSDRDESDDTTEHAEPSSQRPAADRHDEPDENGGAEPPQARAESTSGDVVTTTPTVSAEQQQAAVEQAPETAVAVVEPPNAEGGATPPQERHPPPPEVDPAPVEDGDAAPPVKPPDTAEERPYVAVNGYIDPPSVTPSPDWQNDTPEENQRYGSETRDSIERGVEYGEPMSPDAQQLHDALAVAPPNPEVQYSGGEPLDDDMIDARMKYLEDNPAMPTREQLDAMHYDPDDLTHKREYARAASPDGVVALEYASGTRRQDYGSDLGKADDATRADLAKMAQDDEETFRAPENIGPDDQPTTPKPEPVTGHEVLRPHDERGPAVRLTEDFSKDFLGESIIAGDFVLVGGADLRDPANPVLRGEAARVFPAASRGLADLIPEGDGDRRPRALFVWARMGPR